MLGVVPEWLRLLAWPVHLQADYSPQEIVASTGFGLQEAAGAVLVLGTAMLAWIFRRRAPVMSFGILWTAIALLPVSNVIIPTGVVLAERTLFLPSMGFLLAIGGLLAALWQKAPQTRRSGFEKAWWPVVGVLVVLATVRSVRRQADWKTPEVFLNRSALDAPRSWKTQGALANLLYAEGQRASAIDLYQRAISLAPVEQAWRARNELAERYLGEGRYDMAIEQLRASQAAVPDKRQTWRDLILGYLALGDYPVAARLADSAMALGGSEELFGALRATADSAFREKAPAGTIRIELQPTPQ
jgi:tetratricopeptide (TPR) repeat protein